MFVPAAFLKTLLSTGEANPEALFPSVLRVIGSSSPSSRWQRRRRKGEEEYHPGSSRKTAGTEGAGAKAAAATGAGAAGDDVVTRQSAGPVAGKAARGAAPDAAATCHGDLQFALLQQRIAARLPFAPLSECLLMVQYLNSGVF